MNVIATALPGVMIIEPQQWRDARGFFFEAFEARRYAAAGLPAQFVQDNISRSCYGVLRGLHYQRRHPQGKLIGVTRGAVLDVAVDVRYQSATLGQCVCVELSEENHRQLYIPPGFAHGFCVLSEEVDFYYKCTDFYDPSSEMGVCWNDPALAIPWPIENPILSEKDRTYPCLKDIPVEQLL